MSCLARVLILCLMLMPCAFVRAESKPVRPERQVQFAWEAVEDAEGYQIEIREKGSSEKPRRFELQSSEWAGKLPLGFYEIRMRSVDNRGVPGDWDAPMDLVVPLNVVQLTSPLANAKVTSSETDLDTLKFSWKEVPGAKDYEITVEAEDGSFSKTEVVTETQFKIEVPVARVYRWQVVGRGDGELRSESPLKQSLTLLGRRLETPKVSEPENEFVRELKWTRPEKVEGFDLLLSRWDSTQKKWVAAKKINNHQDTELTVDRELPGGIYQFQLQARSPNRVTSKPTSVRFKLRNGDRSPAAEATAEIRKSIDRFNGWYGIASYLITQVQYSSTNYDQGGGSITAFKALGGTGRLGGGYLSEKHPWGFLGIVDLSGITNEQNENVTFASAEGNGIWRTPTGERGEIRLQAGGFYKELPVATVDSATRQVAGYGKVSTMGPHLAAEYWHSLSAKLGFQVNAHLYAGFLKVNSPNGQSVQPSVSWQTGILGSYRLSRRVTGLMGYAHREDRIDHDSTSSGRLNQTTLTGDYLNLFLEYGF